MNLGDKLRQLRQNKGLTQPEVAEAIGIEQSYLSKLENGKYIPSADVFGRILEVFQLPVSDLVDDLDARDRNQLRQIPDVAGYYNRQKSIILGNRRRWLIGSMMLLAVGAALMYAGVTESIVGGVVYTYVSPGVVLDGEEPDVFQAVFSDGYRRNLGIDDVELLRARIDHHYIQTSQFRGTIFNLPVDGGSRTYRRESWNTVDAWQNNVAAMIGVFLLVLGGTGIFLQKKLSRYQ